MDTKIINHSGYILKLCTTKLWAVDRETKLDKRTLLDPASATRRENTCVVYLPYTNCRYLAHPVLIIAIIGGLLYTFNTGNYT